MRRLNCHNAIKQVKSSYDTALQIVALLIEIVKEEPEYLYKYNLPLGAVRGFAKELHDVYFVRMFACFESSLRHYWQTCIRKTKPLTRHLIISIAGRLGVPKDILDAVHEIRDFRNYLIHEEHEVGRRFTIAEASKHLNAFLARLPREW
jgi:hypothetical protein